MLAVSGIDDTIKIFSADNRAKRDARLGFNIIATQRESENNSSSISEGIPTARNRLKMWDDLCPADVSDEERLVDDAVDREGPPTRDGIKSCRRMDDVLQIRRRNHEERISGVHDADVTVSASESALLAILGIGHGVPRVPLEFTEWRRLFDGET